MEFVIIKYPEVRNVLVNGSIVGQTNTVVNVATGANTFSLDGPQNFRPGTITKHVNNTTTISPLIINDFLPGDPIPPD